MGNEYTTEYKIIPDDCNNFTSVCTSCSGIVMTTQSGIYEVHNYSVIDSLTLQSNIVDTSAT
jgi:hypothetical protein